MFDIGWQELFVLAVLAIIVIGPKDLPRTIRTVTHWIRKARSMARDFQDGVDEMVQDAEIQDIKQQANSFVADEFHSGGVITRELEMTAEQRDWSKAIDDLKHSTDPDHSRKTDIKNQITAIDDNSAPIEKSSEDSKNNIQ